MRCGVLVRFVGETPSVTLARREVAKILQAAGVQSSGLAELLTSELVTNAIEYAGTDFDLVVEFVDPHLRVEIHDGAAVDDMLRDLIRDLTNDPMVNSDPLARQGRGLMMVGKTAVRFGLIDKVSDGKAVWFEMHRDDA